MTSFSIYELRSDGAEYYYTKKSRYRDICVFYFIFNISNRSGKGHRFVSNMEMVR